MRTGLLLLALVTGCQAADVVDTTQVDQAATATVSEFVNRWYGVNDLNLVRYYAGSLGVTFGVPSDYETRIEEGLAKYDDTSIRFVQIPDPAPSDLSSTIDSLKTDPEPHLIYLYVDDTAWVSQARSFTSAFLIANGPDSQFHDTLAAILASYGPAGMGVFRQGNCPRPDPNDPTDPGTPTSPQHPCRHDDFIVVLKKGVYPSTSDHVLIHETGHVLGLAHEAARVDRCNHIAVFSACSDQPEQSGQFGAGMLQNLSPYDVQSIMEYGSTVFCKGGPPCDMTCLPLIARAPAPNATVPVAITADDDCGGGLPTGTTEGFLVEQTDDLSQEDLNVIYEMYPPQLGSHGAGDDFGTATVAADFDDDGYADLAVGAPDAGAGNHGRVFLYKGTFTGLIPWMAIDEPGANRNDDQFGESLAVIDTSIHVSGTVTPPTYALVVGAPRRMRNGNPGAGAVYVFNNIGKHTTPSTPITHVEITAASLGAPASEPYDGFGTAVTAGYINDSLSGITRRDSLVIGSPGGHLVYIVEAGSWTSKGRIGANRATGESFGAALAIGDLDGDGFGDLVVGAPGSGVGGRVYVARGEAASAGVFSSIAAVGEPATPRGIQDQFGTAIAIGRFDSSGNTLVVGAPGRNNGGGAAFVFDPGIALTHAFERNLAEFTSPNTLSSGHFGAALAVGNLDHAGFDDLVVGAPTTSVNAHAAAGVVGIYLGLAATSDATARLMPAVVRSTPNRDRSALDPDASSGAPQNYEHYGSALAIGDFNHRPIIGHQDLAVGAPGRDNSAGVAWVLRGNDNDVPDYPTNEKRFTVLVQRGLVSLYRR